MKRILFLLLISVIIGASCGKKPSNDFPVEPQIYYNGLTPATIDASDTNAALQIKFSFNDGDGDLGYDQTQMVHNIYLKDSRDTSAADTTFGYPFPYISDNMRPKNGSLQGNVVITLQRPYFLISDSLHFALGGDTMFYKIYVQDSAGHKSNVITTDKIYIKL